MEMIYGDITNSWGQENSLEFSLPFRASMTMEAHFLIPRRGPSVLRRDQVRRSVVIMDNTAGISALNVFKHPDKLCSKPGRFSDRFVSPTTPIESYHELS